MRTELFKIADFIDRINNMKAGVQASNTQDLIPYNKEPRQLDLYIDQKKENAEEVKVFKVIDYSPDEVKTKKQEDTVRNRIKNTLKTLAPKKGFHIPDTVMPNNQVQNLVLKYDRIVKKELGEERKFGTRYDKKTKSTIAFRKV